jgi:hypothetical protein
LFFNRGATAARTRLPASNASRYVENRVQYPTSFVALALGLRQTNNSHQCRKFMAAKVFGLAV